MIKITSNNNYIAELLNQLPLKEENIEIIDNPNYIELLHYHQLHTLHKPFHISELLNKINSLPRLLHFGEFTLNINKKQLTFHKQIINLTEKEQGLIICLINHPQGANKTTLMEYTCGYQENADSHTLETHVSRIRQKTSKELITCKNSIYLLNY